MNSPAGISMNLSLDGQWRFELDREDRGIQQRWFARPLTDAIQLPGTAAQQGFGDVPSSATQWTAGIGQNLKNQSKYESAQQDGVFRTPYWLTPQRYYVGAAWYQKTVTIPPDWKDRRIVLHLERPHWQSRVWVDGQDIGACDSLGVPHEFDLGDLLTPGEHQITIRVDNRVQVDVGLDAHSISDQTQGNWNGIVGEIQLRATDRVWIDNAQVYPDARNRKARVVVTMGNSTGAAQRGSVELQCESANARMAVQLSGARSQCELELNLPANTPAWSEFAPSLLQLHMKWQSEDQRYRDEQNIRFGLRDLAIRGTQFTINGRPIFLRGTLDCCIFPITGHPPADEESWKRIYRIMQAHGLNHIRFHSYCPPEAAFAAADEMGIYVQVECSAWAEVGSGKSVDEWLFAEGERMLRHLGNHPSFILMVHGNEPSGEKRDAYLTRWLEHFKAMDSRRFFAAGSGWPELPASQYHVLFDKMRLHATGALNHLPQTAFDYREAIQQRKAPIVIHEMGQWCVYPNPGEISKYTGHLRAGNLEIFQHLLDKSGMGARASEFVQASGKFQSLLYKAEIEAQLRTPGVAGFQLLDLHDFPGQGTAPVGVLDAFWEEKGYISPDDYRRFCNRTVFLARLHKRTFLAHEQARVRIDLFHFGEDDLRDAVIDWRLSDGSASGSIEAGTLATGQLHEGVGDLVIEFPAIASARQVKLIASLRGTNIGNDWDVWIYPQSLPVPNEKINVLRVTEDPRTFTDAAKTIEQGRDALLLLDPAIVAGDTLGSFMPIFWNRITFPGQKEHTLGILCDPMHPALRDFPTDTHSNWQWWELQQNSKPIIVDGKIDPIVQMIDDWDQCRRLGLVWECRIGNARLVICSIDLSSSLETRPVARQLRHSLLTYMQSEHFAPSQSITVADLKSLLRIP